MTQDSNARPAELIEKEKILANIGEMTEAFAKAIGPDTTVGAVLFYLPALLTTTNSLLGSVLAELREIKAAIKSKGVTAIPNDTIPS